jgi:glycosyltransferase involved in cell wall biosynthesis
VIQIENPNQDSPYQLSVIIPIGGLVDDFSKLEHNLISATEFGFQVILILDGLQSDERDRIVTLINKKGPEMKNVSLYETNFRSPGAARNFGLECASGKFITFWDSDDLANCCNIAQSLVAVPDTTDAIIGAFQQTHLLNGSIWISRPKRWAWRVDLLVCPGFWRILYRRDRLGTAQFGKSKMGEDQVFLAKFGIWNKRVKLSEGVFYVYFVGNPNQLTQSSGRFRELRITIEELKSSNHQQNFLSRIFVLLLIVKLKASLFKSKIIN